MVAAMDAHNTSEEQIKALTEQLDAEKLLVKQKDKLLTSTGQRMKVAMAKAIHAFQSTMSTTLFYSSGTLKASNS